MTYWKPDEMVATSTSESTKLIQVPCIDHKYFSVNWTLSRKYISTDLREIHDCDIARIEDDLAVSLLGTPTLKLLHD